MGAVGLLLTTSGFISVLTRTLLSEYLTAAPLSLAAGVLMLAYANHLWRTSAAAPAGPGVESDWTATAQWAIAFVLVAVGLFWATADYSAAVGTWRAHRLVDGLAGHPDGVLYSQKSLSLTTPGIKETRCHDPQAAYRYR